MNIVDYIDDDDYSTPFVWNPANPAFTTPNPNPASPTPSLANPTPGVNDVNQDPTNFSSAAVIGTRVVFGFEAPKAVINEAYVQYENSSTEVIPGTKATKNFHLNGWVELHNPMLSGNAVLQTPPLTDSKGKVLANPYVAYKLIMTDNNTGLDESSSNGRQNVLGQPDSLTTTATFEVYNPTFGNAASLAFPPAVPATAPTDWAPLNGAANASAVLAPANGAFTGTTTSTPGNLTANGFYVLGPQIAHTAKENPTLGPVTTHASTHMTHAFNYKNKKFDKAPASISFLLQRLACPALPPSATNPYVLVDYMEQIPVNDVREVQENAVGSGLLPPQCFSVGRTQPFDAVSSQTTIPRNPKGVVTGVGPGKMLQQRSTNAKEPKNSFLAHNYDKPGTPPKVTGATTSDTLQMPFSWPNHLDRQVISPIELMTVCRRQAASVHAFVYCAPAGRCAHGPATLGPVDEQRYIVVPLAPGRRSRATSQRRHHQWAHPRESEHQYDLGCRNVPGPL